MNFPPSGPFQPHLAAITLGVRNVQRTVEFYRALGLQPDARSDGRTVWIQLNGVLLRLVRRDVLAPEMASGTPGDGVVSFRHAVEDDRLLDAILVRVTRAGGRVLRAPEPGPWMGRRAWFSDLDGHCWELVYDPSLRRDAHGGVWLPPREVLEPFHGDVQPVSEPDTDDLGDALVTAEEPRVGAVAVVVEAFEEDDSVVEAPTQIASVPQPLPRPAVKMRPPAPRPEPEVLEVTRAWTFWRVAGLVLVVAAPLAGGLLALSMLRFALP
jgi:catechol 2,3-dioxygenase-like lactoylglutathione lyase family enzyme